ncbi:DUF4332 domain-containing protein [Novipirellula artificiosorum]|nr:DUF4332 domain-containing protein [Novipirellula artificiosorum]
MTPLISILRAAHCRSTHHFFAVDALPLVQTDGGARLARLLLSHHDRYLTGAKDPDTRFRDFQNHVVHVNDGYWGGAPRVAHQWYDRLMKYLRTDRWSDAAHAAGVLSHYFTDPMQPLHTAQCDLEKVLHRPMEWSVTKSYHAIYQNWVDDDLRVVFQLSDRSGWLGEAILHGARFANRKYEMLIDRYRLEAGVKDPQSGYDAESRVALSELFGLAITGWARVLERAALDAESLRAKPIPRFSLTLPTLMSSIKVPTRLWLRRVESKKQQKKVEDLLEEYQRTGDLREHLPSEVDVVHRVAKIHQAEEAWKAQRLQTVEPTTGRVGAAASDGANPFAAAVSAANVDAGDARFDEPRFDEQGVSVSIPLRATSMQQATLSRDAQLVDAPSIGPKTAARFAAIGIDRVGPFLDAAAPDLAKALATYWITDETIALWQIQTTLTCQVPGLRARDAQMLAGAGCANAIALAASDISLLHQEILRYSTTSAGRRYLRGAKPPSRAEIANWVRSVVGPASVIPLTSNDGSPSELRRSA